jgi:acyl-CoA synthetase (AMP-forming)/AMP-acid ligase II
VIHLSSHLSQQFKIYDTYNTAVHKRNKNESVCVLFTSGSTGTPKGALFNEDLALPTEGNNHFNVILVVDLAKHQINNNIPLPLRSLNHCCNIPGASILFPYIRLDFQSFDPSFILSVLSSMQSGGSRVIVTNLVTLIDDIKLAKPTHMGMIQN